MWCEGINSTWGALGQVLNDLLPSQGKCCGAPGQHRHLVERHLGEGGTSKTKSFNFSTSSKDTDQDELPHIDDDDKDDGENIGAEYYHRVL